MELIAKPEDYLELWEKNPLSLEQLKVVILARLNKEQAAELNQLRKAVQDAAATDA